ncbi:phosphopantetheine-binding protein [Actinokineospora sp. PR83]|uniref:beta-ketoacyl synthase N-terminal-like domain-containing protein n=1 Tax=Actinokineospora sp. PR83 TaxID=2884908 RepID=UPI0027E1EC04|nr:beta-ketoacyl synthase N-terminal-like domain-containing protein [Actinokineospora sp. PR83]MCG8915266.1 phosphopantetheine-binding protein [Actinokineospora sp. PR83]
MDSGSVGGGIAVVGVGLRFPEVESMDQLWSLLAGERCVVGELPARRRETDPGYRETGGEPIRGAFVGDADAFDAAFFGITPREAAFVDPQQRFALELSWHAVEDAGYRPDALRGTRAGVFMGVANSDYTELIEVAGGEPDSYVPTGTSAALIANRVSHWFDLTGPSMTVDTACASSLVALHQAVRAIEAGDCDIALAGAVNLCWSARRFAALRRNGMLSDTGVCRAFDADADGYVRAEGGAVVLLKPLARAVADGDAVHAVVIGSGTNHGGRTGSLTITNPRAHARLIADVHERAGVRPGEVGYIEAHGPGTPLGDPIEVHGLKAAFEHLAESWGEPARAASCGLGSVKTNLGHLESAAGMAGLLKVIAAMRHRTLPATLHLERPNPMVDLRGGPFYLVGDTRPWTPSHGVDGEELPLVAGVSSFGFGGSNAHVLVREHVAARAAATEGPVLVPLSARSEGALRACAARLLEHVRNAAEVDLVAIARTLQEGRAEMAHRAVLLVANGAELVDRLTRLARGDEAVEGTWRGLVADSDPRVELLVDDEDAAVMVRNWSVKGKLAKVAELWVMGWVVAWSELYPDGPPRRVHLPTYPFERERHWLPETGTAVIGTADRGGAGSGVAEAEVVAATVDPSGPGLGSTAAKPTGVRLLPLDAVVPTGVRAGTVGDPVGPVADAAPPATGAPATSRDVPDHAALEQLLVSTLADALYLPADTLDAGTPFVDMGLDSIIVVEWVGAVNARFSGAGLVAADVYDFPTARGLAVELLRRSGGTAPAPAADSPPARPVERFAPESGPTTSAGLGSVLEEELATSLAEVLYLPRADIVVDRKFVDIGLDSIIAVEWARLINSRHRTRLTATAVYEHPTVRELAAHLADQVGEVDVDEVLRQVQAGTIDVDRAEQMLELAGRLS